MRFTLIYEGKLPSSGDAKHKHEIRLALHPQLKELWKTHPALAVGREWIVRPFEGDDSEERGILIDQVGGHDFVSLVHPDLALYAELDILVLRPEAPGAVISQFGDIDNQLKTLFDALRRPSAEGEIPKSWSPSEEEAPTHCLLADDKLITRVNVETDRLLVARVDPKHVMVTMRVTVKGFTATWGNLGLIG
jgi:hypothetical protein